MSLEKEFPPPQVTAAPTQVPIQEQIAKAFTDDAKTITPAGTRHEETATAAGPDQIPTKSLQVSNNQEEGTKEPSWAEVAVSEVKSVKEHLGSDHKPSKAAAPEAELEAVTKKMGEMTIDRAKELASSAAETAKGAAVEARDKTEGLAAAIADATSHGIQTAKSTITEAGQTLVRAGEGGAERVTEVAQSATAKAGEAGHAPAETLQGAAHTVVETAEHAIAAVEDKIEEVAERAHDIAEAEWHEKPSHPSMALLTDVKAVIESVGESIAEAVGLSRSKETEPDQRQAGVQELTQRLKEHGIDVEHPAGTGPIRQPSSDTLNAAGETIEPPKDSEDRVLKTDLSKDEDDKILRQQIHLDPDANAFEKLKSETDVPDVANPV